MWSIIYSKIDNSVNFYKKITDKQFIECRYVERNDHFIVYISTFTGCNKACRFCHLTQTKQTSFAELNSHSIIEQVIKILKYYKQTNKKFLKVHYNFMVRGEPLSSNTLCNDWSSIRYKLKNLASELGLPYKINISTIFPLDSTLLPKKLKEDTTLYYSLYSIDRNFRKKWIPKAKNPQIVLNTLSRLQHKYNNPQVKIHWALIKNENDNFKNTIDLIRILLASKIKIKGINLVMYNPYSQKQGECASNKTYKSHQHILQQHFNNVKIIPRVGFDVKASCGMFINE